jgi:hypothetical protein
MKRRVTILVTTLLAILAVLAGLTSHYTGVRLRVKMWSQQLELWVCNERVIFTRADRITVSGVVDWSLDNPHREYPRWRARREIATNALDLRWEPLTYRDWILLGQERGTIQQVKVQYHPSKPLRIDEVSTKGTYITLDARCYVWALLFGLWPALSFVRRGLRRRRERRLRYPVCLSCGYDLRASSKKCPECGAAVHGG